MNNVRVLMHGYYEVLHGLLLTRQPTLLARMKELLQQEAARRGYDIGSGERLSAYDEACEAFLAERIEMYDPVGHQYVFDQTTTRSASELERQLSWYDSRQEFERLVVQARELVEDGLADGDVAVKAWALVEQLGAYPDQSILSGYEAGPGQNRLPDWVVARAIEDELAGVER